MYKSDKSTTENTLKNDISSKNLVQILQNYGIIDTDTDGLLELIEMKKREEIIKMHIEKFHKIWENTNKGLYLTYVPDDTKPKNRRQISASTQDALEDKIVAFYQDIENQKKKAEKQAALTLRKLYPDWLAYKSLKTTATSYIRRIDDDWKAYYLKSKIIDIPLAELDKLTCEKWVLEIIQKKHLTKTQYYNMSIILRQGLEYAVESNYITKNVFEKVKVDKKLFLKKQKPEDNTQVFLTDERPLIEEEAWTDYNEKGCSACLAIPLAFQLGVRLGELVSIKGTDIEGNYVHIQRMAQKQERQRPDGTWYPAVWKVVEHTKSSAGDRFVYLSQEARRIIKILMDANEEKGYRKDDFLFLHNGKFISPRAVDTRIRKYCDHININRKSTHKIRKTFISTLLDAGININEVRKCVGHEREQTTLKNYTFNRQTSVEKENAFEKALAS